MGGQAQSGRNLPQREENQRDAKLNNGFGAWGRRCAERFPYSILSGVVKWRLAFLAVFYLYDVILAL